MASVKTSLYAVRWAGGLSLLLFGSAGTIDWPGAIIFLILLGVCIGAMGVRLSHNDPALLAERQKSFWQAGQPYADKIFMAVFLGVGAAWLVLMGCDAVRFRWSVVPVAWRIIGAVLIVAGAVVIDGAMAQNSFAAPVVKLQPERAQFVARGGLYGVVRHPMYAGLSLIFLGMPLILGAAYGLIGTGILIGLFASRIRLEESLLLAGLTGYREYTQQVRFRLIPYIW